MASDHKPDMGSDDPYYKQRMAQMLSNPDEPGYAVIWASPEAQVRYDKHRDHHVIRCKECGVFLFAQEDGPFRKEQILLYGIPPICLKCAGQLEDPEVELE